MSNVDKNQAVIDFLMQMDYIKDNYLFFNFANASDNNKQLVVSGNDKSLNKSFIDGSVLKRFTFNIIDYKSIAYNPLINMQGYSNENVDELLDVQSMIDWITEQDKLNNYPDFGENCHIESMKALSDQPMLNGVDISATPSLAKYSISILIEYLDISKVLWNN